MYNNKHIHIIHNNKKPEYQDQLVTMFTVSELINHFFIATLCAVYLVCYNKESNRGI
jgi:hypothetical protein